jgi:dTDP-4-amino-4,6-dideoxygalactose transaminase
MQPIPLINLKRQLQPLKSKILQGFEKTFDDMEFTYGQATKRFEEKFSKLCHTKYALGVNSGTTSLIIALKAAQIGPGDEVITTPVTFAASADAIIQTGAKPVFVDIDPQTGNIDPKKIPSAITSRTKAILLVHLYGVPADMDRITTLCKKYQLILIEDASHAHGSLYKNKPVGSFGLAGCFSLYPSKTLGAVGNAGVITSNSKKFINLARMHAHHGIKSQKSKYTHHLSGTNSLINNIQSTALLIKMGSLQKWIKKKKAIAEKYNAVFQKSGHPGMIWTPNTEPSLYVYAVQIAERNKFQKFFEKQSIGTGIYYPTPLHLQPSMRHFGYKKGDFPIAEKFMSRTVSLPLYPELTNQEIKRITKTIEAFFQNS